eukprot:7597245-Pyramimonas_sp.AAC.1
MVVVVVENRPIKVDECGHVSHQAVVLVVVEVRMRDVRARLRHVHRELQVRLLAGGGHADELRDALLQAGNDLVPRERDNPAQRFLVEGL